MTQPWAPVTIASVVEGDGEVRALPKGLRVPRGKLICAGELERAVAAMAVRVPGQGGVLVLLDADDDCPAELGPRLLDRARKARPDKLVAVVLANREFEAWYLAAAPSLAGEHGFPEDFSAPPDPGVPRDCKGLLTRARAAGHSYKETVDQAALASVFDLEMARAGSPSFAKFCRDVGVVLAVGGG